MSESILVDPLGVGRDIGTFAEAADRTRGHVSDRVR